MGVTVNQISVRDQIETDFKDYSMYVIQARGIPNFYDGLTPAQRLALLHAPDKIEATVSLIGRVMQTGLYHHGDASLGGSIARQARTFMCAEPLLFGDGFFGSPVEHRAASPRYTKVKSLPAVKTELTQHSMLNERNEEGGFDWLHVELPLGLCLHTVGIAVGYSSVILPRRLQDMRDYIEGKPKKLYPHFMNFAGTVKKLDTDTGKSAWLIEGVVREAGDGKIRVECIPPLMKYSSFLTKLVDSLSHVPATVPYKLYNESKKDVDITVHWKDKSTYSQALEAIERCSRMGVVETLVFVRDGGIVEYLDIKHYLDDFRVHREVVRYKRLAWDVSNDTAESEFLAAKIAFMKFMLERKRTNTDIAEFMSEWKDRIRKRLETIRLTSLSKEELEGTERKLEALLRSIAERTELMRTEKSRVMKLQKSYKSASAMHMGSESLSDLDIEVYKPDDDTDEHEDTADSDD
jgi:DNA gyrase/topoisomerase IV subunit A